MKKPDKAALEAIRHALHAPIVNDPDMGSLAVVLDYIETTSEHGTGPIGGCEVCLAVSRLRTLRKPMTPERPEDPSR